MKTKLSRRSFFAFGAAAYIPASAQVIDPQPFKKILRPEKGSWELTPSAEGWKLLPRTGCFVHGASMLVLGLNRETFENKGSITLIPADPKKGAVELLDSKELSIKIYESGRRIQDSINAAIIQLAMEGHSLAHVKLGWSENGNVLITLTSTQPFGVGKAVAEMPQDGILG